MVTGLVARVLFFFEESVVVSLVSVKITLGRRRLYVLMGFSALQK
jgi:hypothetical protein